MQITIESNKETLGQQAAQAGATLIRTALDQQETAHIIVATGASQFEMLGHLAQADLDWHRVVAFHLDEYVGLPITHPASFRKYLWERFVSQLPFPLLAFHYLNGETKVNQEINRVGQILSNNPIDVAFIGIGENGHLAFNDPPADFETEAPYLLVTLDEACRQQQVGEGWFPTIDDVPPQAISMSIRQILKSKAIICTVPDARKARAVQQAAKGPITPNVPASILQQHPQCSLFLDTESSALLTD
jgi:glucosamine-6-phosphate deaminase